mgnify:CR=1 FL=1
MAVLLAVQVHVEEDGRELPALGPELAGAISPHRDDVGELLRGEFGEIGDARLPGSAERMQLPGAPGLAREELLTLIRNREAAARLA